MTTKFLRTGEGYPPHGFDPRGVNEVEATRTLEDTRDKSKWGKNASKAENATDSA